MVPGQQWAMASLCSTLCRFSLTVIRPQSKAEAILHTCLALARAFVRCAENADVSLRARRTSEATRLAVQLLVEIAEPIADDAAGLPALGLEET